MFNVHFYKNIDRVLYFFRFLKVLDGLATKVRDNRAFGNILFLLNEQACFVTAFHDELRSRLNSAAQIYLEDKDEDQMWQRR